MSNKVKFVPSHVEALERELRALRATTKLIEKHVENAKSKTEPFVQIAHEAKTVAQWDADIAELKRKARVNKRYCASIGFEQYERERGKTKTIDVKPERYSAVILSTLRQSLAHGVTLSVGGKLRSFNAIKEDKAKKVAAKKKAALTDTDKDIQAIADMFDVCMIRLKAMSPEDVHAMRERIKTEFVPLFPVPSKSKKAA